MRIWPLDSSIAEGIHVSIEGPDARHLIKVLRVPIGERLKICDKDGRTHEAKVSEIGRDSLTVEVLKACDPAKVPPPRITLALSMTKMPVMELVIQKAVELGCMGFAPVATERSLTDGISPSRMERLRRIAHEAYKQSGRAAPITIYEPVKIAGLPHADLKMALWEMEKNRSVKDVLSTAALPETITVLIGPQSGFSEKEIDAFASLGFQTAKAGDLILRTETAAIAAISIINYHFDKM